MNEEERIEALRKKIIEALRKSGLEVNTDRMEDNGLIIDIADEEYCIRFVEETPETESEED